MQSIIELDNQTKERFAAEVKNNKQVQKLVEHLNHLSENTSELKVEKVLQVSINDEKVVVVHLKNDNNTVRVHYQTKPVQVFGRVIIQEGDKRIAKVIDGNQEPFEVVKEYAYTKELEEALVELQNKQLPNMEEDMITPQSLFCIHGNWCGPLCSGPEDPETQVDACCKEHDICYGDSGYFNCECDARLQWCLLPYVQEGSEWAILVFEYFNLQPCRD